MRGVVLVLAAWVCGQCLAADPVAATRVALQEAKRLSLAQPKAEPIAREEFLRPPTIGDVRLSPDGRQLSVLKHEGQRINVFLQDVASGKQTRVISSARQAKLAWSGDGRRLWVADEGGLAVVDANSRAAKRILKWDPRRSQSLWAVDPRATGHAIVHEKVFLETIAGHDGERHRYLLVDAQGKSRLLHEARWPLLGVLLSADGRLRFAAGNDGPRYDIVIREYTAAGKRDLLRCTGLETCLLAGYNEARKTLWILSQHGEDRLALQRWQDKRWETVHRDPAGIVDADSLLWDQARQDWLAIAYESDRRHWYGNGADAKATLAALQRHLPDASLQPSRSGDGRIWLVRASTASWRFARHFLYHPAQDRLQPLFETTPTVKESFVAMHAVRYRARDGMLLHGYVLLPNGIASAQAPLVAWLHGGPVNRVYDQYDPGVQLLVNRGNAVFLPNFRGSNGYGLRYALAGKGDAGNGRMLADIIDGLDFLLAEGIGDRRRQAVVGHSFGGYAGLLAVSHHPRRFRFAFAGAAPVDYGWIKQWQAGQESEVSEGPPPGGPVALRFAQYGYAFENRSWREQMRRESPLANVARLRAPVYLWAGAKDGNVPLKSISQYVGAARVLDKPLSVLIDPDAGHVPDSALGGEAWLYLLETAAHRQFGSVVTPPSLELQAFMKQNLR